MSHFIVIIIITALLKNSKIESEASCTEDQIKTCQQTATSKNSKPPNSGECTTKQYVHFSHICVINNYIPGLDFCCCQIPHEAAMCCRYHQHWNIYRCVQDKDTFLTHEKNLTSFYLVTSYEIMLPIVLLPAAIFVFWIACCCLFRVNSCRRRLRTSTSDHVTKSVVRTTTKSHNKCSCCIGGDPFGNCGYELAQDTEWDGSMFPKQTTETNNNIDCLPYKMNFDLKDQNDDDDDDNKFYQSDTENNNNNNSFTISCIEVLSSLEHRSLYRDNAGAYKSTTGVYQDDTSFQQVKTQQSGFLDCIPYKFIILKPLQSIDRRTSNRSIAHVQPTIYRHQSCVTETLNRSRSPRREIDCDDVVTDSRDNKSLQDLNDSNLYRKVREPFASHEQLDEQHSSNI